MRWPLAIVMLYAAACDQRYGTYLTVDGDSAAIGFDSVELYFGSALDLETLQTPTRAGMGKVFKRRFDATDLVPVDANSDGTLSRETTFYLPVDDANLKLGDYVLALAYVNGEPAGVGELLGFDVEAGVVFSFDIELQPYQPLEVDRWGEEPNTCVAWTKHRDSDPPFVRSTHAVVRDDDRDCDGIMATADCNDAAYCAPGTECGPSLTCGSEATCSLGCGTDAMTCMPKLCLYPGFCSANCQLPSIDSRHECGIKVAYDHIEATVHTSPDRVCTPMLKFRPYALDCKDARLEFAETIVGETATFTVSDDGINCIVDIVTPAADPVGVKHHMVISFQGPDPATRWSFILGVERIPGNLCDASTVPGYTVLGAPADCK